VLIEDAFAERSCGAFEDTSGEKATDEQPVGMLERRGRLVGNIGGELPL
jgi:hypothetical protein